MIGDNHKMHVLNGKLNKNSHVKHQQREFGCDLLIKKNII